MAETCLSVGVDGCPGGWIAAIQRPGKDWPDIAVFANFAALVDSLPGHGIIAVDMPIGLPDACGPGGRGPERLVRPLLGARQSSAFSIPSRAAVFATDAIYRDAAQWKADHLRASAVARSTSQPPRGVSVQAYGLFSRIQQVDTLLRQRPELRGRVIESHPELAFWRMNGRRPLAEPKKVKNRPWQAGLAERIALLVAQGFAPPSGWSHVPRGAGADDLLDALAMLDVARRQATGHAGRLPDPPLHDSAGLPIAIYF